MGNLEHATPFYFKRGYTGCLLVHGFTGSPAELRELGEFLAANQITVRCDLLPGHGSTPEELAKIRWDQWYTVARNGLEFLHENCNKVFICGLSMGGTLSLHLASHYQCAGVISLAGAIFVRDWRLKFLPILKYIKKYDRKIGDDIKDPIAKKNAVCYDKTPVKSVVELLQLFNHVKSELSDIRCPILIIHAKEDHTVPVDNAQYIYDNVSSKDKTKIELDDGFHVITTDYSKELVKKYVLEFIYKH